MLLTDQITKTDFIFYHWLWFFLSMRNKWLEQWLAFDFRMAIIKNFRNEYCIQIHVNSIYLFVNECEVTRLLPYSFLAVLILLVAVIRNSTKCWYDTITQKSASTSNLIKVATGLNRNIVNKHLFQLI